MMKSLFYGLILIAFPLLLGACRQHQKETQAQHHKESKQAQHSLPQQNKDAEQEILDSVSGDFNGDGNMECAQIVLVEAGEADERPWKMQVIFTDKNLPHLSFQSDQYYANIINSGNLNGKAGDELTLILPANHGNFQTLQPYTLRHDKWSYLFEAFLTPTDMLVDPSDSIFIPIQQRIFKSGNEVYYYDYQNIVSKDDEEHFEFVKVKAKL
jgi:hypothetical protein